MASGYKCSRCGFTTTTEVEMRRHVAYRHNDASSSAVSSDSFIAPVYPIDYPPSSDYSSSSDSFSGGGGDFGGGGASGSFD